MTLLYLTRHGETEENASGVLQGQSPGHLNQQGIAQAEELCRTLRDVPFDVLLCSDLKRAIDTATIVAAPHNLSLTLTPLLRERDWGEFTGHTIASIRVRPADFPPSVENPEQLATRARDFLSYLMKNFDGKTVLAVGHGYFDRCIQAILEGKPVHDTPRWGNAEVRTFQVDDTSLNRQLSGDTEVSAD